MFTCTGWENIASHPKSIVTSHANSFHSASDNSSLSVESADSNISFSITVIVVGNHPTGTFDHTVVVVLLSITTIELFCNCSSLKQRTEKP